MEHIKSLLVLGGSSDIGRATALRFAVAGQRIFLAGRDLVALQREADDIAARTGAKVSVSVLDILDTGSFETFVNGLSELPDTILCVIGLLGDQSKAETDLVHAREIICTNFEGPALLFSIFAERFAQRGTGTIIGVSSVAGERGRAANYLRCKQGRFDSLPLWIAQPFRKIQDSRGHSEARLCSHPDDPRNVAAAPFDRRAGTSGSGNF